MLGPAPRGKSDSLFLVPVSTGFKTTHMKSTSEILNFPVPPTKNSITFMRLDKSSDLLFRAGASLWIIKTDPAGMRNLCFDYL
jgi:hypothetical protein